MCARRRFWNDGDGSATGGGISAFFPVPEYQQNLAMPTDLLTGFKGRGVPDVSGVADPQTGYAVFVHGRWTIVGGTSAVAPLFAGLVARLNERMNSKAGFINNAIYAANGTGVSSDNDATKPRGLINDISEGHNCCRQGCWIFSHPRMGCRDRMGQSERFESAYFSHKFEILTV